MTVSWSITWDLTKQNIHVFIMWECRRSCRYRTGTDRVISLQAKIICYPRALRSFSPVWRDYAYCASFMLFVYLCPFCWAGTFCKAQAEVWCQPVYPALTNTADPTPTLFGGFQLVIFASNWDLPALGVEHSLFQMTVTTSIYPAVFSLF